MSPAKEEEIKISVAAHLGKPSGLFERRIVNKKDIENANEKNFMIKIDNGKMLELCGMSKVKYADVMSGGKGFTMVLLLTGRRDEGIGSPFLVFKNKTVTTQFVEFQMICLASRTAKVLRGRLTR